MGRIGDRRLQLGEPTAPVRQRTHSEAIPIMNRLALTPDMLRSPAGSAVRLVARSRVLAVLDQAVHLEVTAGSGLVSGAHPVAVDPREVEAVHDFRVALRRLRSWLRACRPFLDDAVTGETKRRLRQLARRAGRLRDLEIQDRALGEIGTDQPASAAAIWLRRRLRSDQRAARRRLMHGIEVRLPGVSERALRRLGRGATECDDAAAGRGDTMAAATATMIHAHAETLRHAVDAWQRHPASVGAAHAARIALKRLRYLLEAFGDSSPLATLAVAHLAGLQDALGRIHDAQMLSQTMTAVMRRTSHPPRVAVAALRRTLALQTSNALRDARMKVGRKGLGAALAAARRLELDLHGTPAHAAGSVSGCRHLSLTTRSRVPATA